MEITSKRSIVHFTFVIIISFFKLLFIILYNRCVLLEKIYELFVRFTMFPRAGQQRGMQRVNL